MSKKYIESMNKITVDDKLKKRILQKVSEVKEEDNINTVTSINKSRYNKMWTKSVGLVAACCAFVVCTSLNSKFPELFNKGNVNLNNENVENDNSDIDNSIISDENNVSENNINSEGIGTNNEDADTGNVNNTNKEDNNYINNTGKETRNKVADNQIHQQNTGNNQNDYGGSNAAEADLNSDVQEQSSSGNNAVPEAEDHNNSENVEVHAAENNNYDNGTYEAAVADYLVNNDSTDNSEEKNTSASTVSKLREMPGNMQEEFEIPEVLKNNAEITYTLLVSDDVMEVGYKDEHNDDGVLRISSHKMEIPQSKNYPKVETLKAGNCEAVIRSNEDNTKKIAEWEFNHKFYSLKTDGDSDNEDIIKIIESCR